MRALIQRVTEASVEVEGVCVGAIHRGLLVLLGVDKHDSEETALRMIDKLLAYRVFPDDEGKMNCSVTDIAGELLIVSQFTLSADTKKGLRPSFSSAAAPELAERLYNFVVNEVEGKLGNVASGVFGADMKVRLLNDGPVTFLLEIN
ncbi:MAG: D-tyrosyl-tRNA(Tyr) deacylase [Pseudomonadales bacterium]|nr:D-tyrosyl-tRNA(Tyr) deacylase [Pseudomonadales bacterium]